MSTHVLLFPAGNREMCGLGRCGGRMIIQEFPGPKPQDHPDCGFNGLSDEMTDSRAHPISI
jgi:hypothetical protein